MITSNIERFDEIVGIAFARLYENFPVPVALLAGLFVDEEHLTDKMSGFLTDQAKFSVYCLYWLADTGYISGKPHEFGLLDAVLTAKGLETLKAVPDSLNAPDAPPAPLGERIVQAVKTEGANTVRSLVNQALGVGLQVLTR